MFTREELLRGIWGHATFGHTRTLDSHAFRLRRKLAAAEPGRELVINVWGVGYRLCNSEVQTVSAPDQVTDLYRELARHRVEETIDRLGRAPLDRLVAQAAEVLEEAAGALACMTALYATPGGTVDQRWQQQINDLIAAAASLEQLADFSRHCTTDTNHDQRGDN